MPYYGLLDMLDQLEEEGIISDREIDDVVQCAHVDMSAKNFYFRLKDRDTIAARIEPTGWKVAFLEMTTYNDRLKAKTVHFVRPNHAFGTNITRLSAVTPAF